LSHAVLQHTPSTQLPEPQSLDAVHVLPSGFEQVPLPFALHTSPEGQVSTVQHTPSVHLPDAHCELDVQTVPSAPVVTQLPDEVSQKYPLLQSALLAQVVLHAVGPHTNGSHGEVAAGAQLPSPSQ
jgi:hypothetical protein